MPWPALLTSLCAWLAGLGLMHLAGTARARTCLERYASAQLAGFALLGAACVAWGVWVGGVGPDFARALQLSCVPLGLWALARGRRSASRELDGDAPQDAEPLGALGRAAALLAVLLGLVALFAASTQPLWSFDATHHFAYKAQLLFHEGIGGEAWTALDGDLGRVMTHPGYPPGLPALEALASSWRGEFRAEDGRPLSGLFCVLGAMLLWTTLARRSRKLAACAALAWLSLPLIYVPGMPHWGVNKGFALTNHFLGSQAAMEAYPGLSEVIYPDASRFKLQSSYTLDGGADLPLGVWLLAAFLALARLWPLPGARRDRADVLLAALLLSGVALCKNEGLALSLVILFALFLASLAARLTSGARAPSSGPPWPLALGLALVVCALCVTPWMIARAELPAIDEDYPARLLALTEDSTRFRARMPLIGRAMQECLLPMFAPATQTLHLLWSALFLAAFYGWAWVTRLHGGRRAQLGFVLALVGGAAALAHYAPIAWFPGSIWRWSFLWPLLLGALAWRAARPRSLFAHPYLGAALAAMGGCLLYVAILGVTPWGLPKLFETLIPDRLLLHLTPLAVLAGVGLLLPQRQPG